MQKDLTENQAKLESALADAKSAVQVLANTIVAQNSEIVSLKKRLDSTPAFGAMRLTNQISEKKRGNLSSALKDLIR
jgi:hypothetical protein